MLNEGYAIETDGLTRRFGAFVAVDGVTLRIPKGHLYGFLGLNGAGKDDHHPHAGRRCCRRVEARRSCGDTM